MKSVFLQYDASYEVNTLQQRIPLALQIWYKSNQRFKTDSQWASVKIASAAKCQVIFIVFPTIYFCKEKLSLEKIFHQETPFDEMVYIFR